MIKSVGRGMTMKPVTWLLLIVGGIVLFITVIAVDRKLSAGFVRPQRIDGGTYSGDMLSREATQKLRAKAKKMNLAEFYDEYELRQGRNDFEGVIAIHNSTKEKWYITAAWQVYDETMKLVRGEKKPQIYRDILSRDYCSIRIIRLEDSGFDDCETLRRALEFIYTDGEQKY